jgi:DNA-binding response OmpR family regulator
VPLTIGSVSVDPSRRTARRGDRELELTRREFDLLHVLVRHPGQVLTRYQLLDLVWGLELDTETNTVDVFVGYLRRKLEAEGEPRLIHTVRGVGFRWAEEPVGSGTVR